MKQFIKTTVSALLLIALGLMLTGCISSGGISTPSISQRGTKVTIKSSAKVQNMYDNNRLVKYGVIYSTSRDAVLHTLYNTEGFEDSSDSPKDADNFPGAKVPPAKNDGYMLKSSRSYSRTYTLNKLRPGSQYYLRTYLLGRYWNSNQSANSQWSYSRVKAFTVLGKPTVRAASSSYSSNTISWASVKGAQKYQVYASTSPGGRYQAIATTAKRSIRHTRLVTGKQYYYRVRAVTNNQYGPYSALRKSRPLPGQVKGISASSSNSKIRISWKAVSGATTYWVLRSTDPSGSFKPLTSVRNLTYTGALKSAAGSAYYYRIQAVRVVHGTLYKGKPSSLISR